MRAGNVLVLLFISVWVNLSLGSVEDSTFDRYKQDPIDYLTQAYSESQFLNLANVNHTNFKAYIILRNLLERVGMDPKLKFLILERPFDLREFYESLSSQNLEKVLETFDFPNEQSKKLTLCKHSEWAYTIRHFFPFLQELNQKRIALRYPPIVVKTFDSVPSTQKTSWPGENKFVQTGSCKLEPTDFTGMGGVSVYLTHFAASGNREQETARLFEQEILKVVKPQDKIIMVYHVVHTIRGFTSCFPFMIDPENWISNWVPLNWNSYILKRHPGLREKQKIVILDEKDQMFAPNGWLHLSSRQAQRYPSEGFGVPLKPFGRLLNNRGIGVIQESAFLRVFHGGQHFSQLRLDQMLDGLVWSHDAHINFQLNLRSPKVYLPQYCREN